MAQAPDSLDMNGSHAGAMQRLRRIAERVVASDLAANLHVEIRCPGDPDPACFVGSAAERPAVLELDDAVLHPFLIGQAHEAELLMTRQARARLHSADVTAAFRLLSAITSAYQHAWRPGCSVPRIDACGFSRGAAPAAACRILPAVVLPEDAPTQTALAVAVLCGLQPQCQRLEAQSIARAWEAGRITEADMAELLSLLAGPALVQLPGGAHIEGKLPDMRRLLVSLLTVVSAKDEIERHTHRARTLVTSVMRPPVTTNGARGAW